MTAVSHLTYPGVFLAVFARQLCLPVPALLFLIVAGTLASHGQLNVGLVMAAGVLGCMGGDFVWFQIGRRWGTRVLRIVCSFSRNPRGAAQRAHDVFRRWGLRVLLVAKFIPGLDGVTPPLAGAEGTSVASFLLFDAFGALLWSSVYIALGYGFADRLSVAIAEAMHFGTTIALLVLIPLALYVLWRAFILLHMIGKLRLRRIGSALLASKLRAGDRVAVIDLASFEGEERERGGIPGAVRADPVRLSSYPKLTIPEDVEVVLYCSSRNAITSARVAVEMQRKGITNIWVLQGGFASWKAEGNPVTQELSTPQELFHRLGVELPAHPGR
jgi:membrane protein DedA with SNARE-associated domain/rhodanese-related sulfurtransferase